MRFFYFLITILLLPSIIFAQSNYNPGYVIKADGDTLKGYINYREWYKTPGSIEFKLNPADESPMVFSASNSNGFQINGFEKYVTYIGLLSMNKIEVGALSYRADTTRKPGRVFMKELVTGKYITLYFQSDDTKARYFINDASTNGPVELMYYRFTNDNSEVTDAAIYKAQLKLHIGKYYHKGEFDDDIKNAAFEQIDLAELIKKVNSAPLLSANLKSGVRFFAGPAFNSTTVNANGINQINSPQFVSVAAPRINAGADIIFVPEIQHLILRLEVSFSYIQPKFAFKADPGYSVSSTSDIHYTFNQYTTTFTPQFIVNVYNTKPLKVYLDGGFGFNFSSYSGQHLSVTNTSSFGTVLHNEYDKPYVLNPFWLSVPFQAGIVFSKFEIHASYMFKANYNQHKTADNVLNINNQTLSAGVNYLF